MTHPDFVYTTYIKTTPEKLWAAITTPEFSRQYWTAGIVSDWVPGSRWHHYADDGKTETLGGEVVESTPPKRLVLSWAHTDAPEDDSQVSFDIEVVEDMVRLQVTHGRFKPESKLVGPISDGWPRVLSSLKSMLETGQALNTWAGVVRTCSSTTA